MRAALLILVGPVVGVVAQTSDAAASLGLVREFGAIAVLVAVGGLWLSGRLISRGDHQRVVDEMARSLVKLREDRDAERAERLALQDRVDSKVIPLLERTVLLLDRFDGGPHERST